MLEKNIGPWYAAGDSCLSGDRSGDGVPVVGSGTVLVR